MENRRIIVVTAISALFISILMSAYFTRSHKQKIRKLTEEASKGIPGGTKPPIIKKPQHKPGSKPKDGSKSKNGWASVLLPFYSLGILGYIVYVVAKIVTKRYSDLRKDREIKVSWRKQRSFKGNTKTKITMHELQQLEQKLMETEEAVQHIFNQTCVAVKAAAKACDSCSSDDDHHLNTMKRFKSNNIESESSDEQPRLHSSMNKFPKANGINPTSKLYTRGTRTRRLRKRQRASDKDFHIHSSQSDSEPENSLSLKNSSGPSDNLSDADSYADLEDFDSPRFKYGCPNENDEILKTANSLRQTMTQLQSYIDDKKSDVDGS